MKRLFFIVLVLALVPMVCHAADPPNEQLWERHSINFGLFLTDLETSLRLGAGIGVDVDVEKALELDTSLSVFRLDGQWRFSDNLRHRLDFSWLSFHREASRVLDEEIRFEDKEGNEIVLEIGQKVKSRFNMDFYRIAYSYSFIQDNRIDLAFSTGLYVAPIDTSIEASGIAESKGKGEFTAPLPTIGLRLDIALTPKWFVRYQTNLLYLTIDTFTGSILQSTAALEYKAWNHVSFGLGFDTMRIKIKSEGEDYPNIDFTGTVEFQYTGLMVYTKINF